MNSELKDSLNEIQQFPILLETLSAHKKQPKNEKIERIVLDNLELAHHSLKTVNKEKHVPSKCMLNNIIDCKLFMENYFRQRGYEDKVSKKLGLVYKETLSLLKRVTQGKVKVDISKLTEEEAKQLVNWNANITYKYYLHKYKTQLINQISRGEKPFLKDIEGDSPIDQIRQIAVSDARNWSYSGMDNDRGDLRRFYGTETMGELLDERMLLACNKISEEKEKEHLRKLGLDQTEELSSIEKVVNSIISDVQSRRAIS